MKAKKYCFIYFGFYISPSGQQVIEVRPAEKIYEDYEDKLEIVSDDINHSTEINILSLREFTEKYNGYIYLNKSYNHYTKRQEGWIY